MDTTIEPRKVLRLTMHERKPVMAQRKMELNTARFNRLVRKMVRAEIEAATRPGDTDAVRARTKARKAYQQALLVALPSAPARCIPIPEPVWEGA